jgi:hypothetical protein
MKTHLKFAMILLATGIACGYASGQNNAPSTAKVSITVRAAPVAASVSITPNATSYAAGSTATLQVAVKGPTNGPVPTGSVVLMVEAPGQTAYTQLQEFALTNGAVTCTYPIPATAPLGKYSIKAVYQGDTNYY